MIRSYKELVRDFFRLRIFPEDLPVAPDKIAQLFDTYNPHINVDAHNGHFVLRDNTGKHIRSFVFPFDLTELVQFIDRIERDQIKPAMTYHGIGLTKDELDKVIEFALVGANKMEQEFAGTLTHLEENTIEKIRRLNLRIQQGLE